MRIKRFIIAGGMIFFLLAACFAGSAAATKGPVASVPESHYQFDPVVEGTVVLHDFIIENQGDVPLIISDVKTTCGCTTAFHSPQVAPGEKGSVSIRADTQGYGDNRFAKDITVSTNAGELALQISGQVKRFVEIEPKNIVLTGSANEKIQASLSIIPSPQYPFAIVETTAANGKNIRFTLTKASDRYILNVENLLMAKGKYFDVITLKTDNSAKPEISIRVFGNISEPEGKKS